MTTRSGGWPAPAKINLFLHVLGRRADGYHLLQTLFQFVDRADDIDFTVHERGEVRRTSELPGVDAADDLVVRAANALREATGTRRGVDIAVSKRLPLGGGLGGGSSDCATVLVALNALWQLDLTVDELASIGLALGADVPVFVRGQAAWAEGVGEVLVPAAPVEGAVVVVTPPCAVDTRRVFSDPDLTRDTPPITMRAFSLERSRNDCEPVTRRLYPEVADAFDWLARHAPTRMSGTGASVFAMFDDPQEAAAVAAQVPPTWATFAARRVNRSPLADRLEAFRRTR